MELLESAYRAFKARNDAFEAWRGGRSGYLTSSVPDHLKITNEERTACELYEWLATPPETYFLYIKHKDSGVFMEGEYHSDGAQTWMGTPLGAVYFGRRWRDNMGASRQSIRVIGNNGVRYHGTYYASSGDYARIKRVKRQAR